MADKDFVVKNGLVVGDTAMINGVLIDPSGATSGQILKFDGTKFAPAEDSIDATVTSYSETIGDGTNSTYTITHNLSTKNISVTVRDANSPYDVVQVRWEASTSNSIILDFSAPVSSSSRRVYVSSAGTLDFYTETIGDGTTSSIELNHGLGSRDVDVVVINASSPYEIINVAKTAPSANKIILDFSSPPQANSLIASVYLPLDGYSYSQILGDSSSTSFVLNHNLNTSDINLITRDTQDPYSLINIRWEATTANSATVYFESAPTQNSRKVTVFSGIGGKKYTPSFGDISTAVPVSSSSSGTTGDIAFDSSYIYVCTAPNTWKRVTLSSW